MKKNIVVIALSLLVVLTFAPLTQGITGEQMASEILGSEPAPGATVADVKKIVGDERKKTVAGIRKENKKLLTEKDLKTAKAVEDQTKEFVESSKNNATHTDVKSTGNQIGDQNYKNTWLLGGIIIAGFIILGILILRRRNNNMPALPQSVASDRTDDILATITAGVETVVKKVDEVPVRMAAEVKKVDMAPLTFETEGHSVIFRLEKDKNGLLKSICVPKSIKCEYDEAKIPTFAFDHRGKLFTKTLKVITEYLATNKYEGREDIYSRMQKKAIEAAAKLKIVEL